jgi:hypothetical protein
MLCLIVMIIPQARPAMRLFQQCLSQLSGFLRKRR